MSERERTIHSIPSRERETARPLSVEKTKQDAGRSLGRRSPLACIQGLDSHPKVSFPKGSSIWQRSSRGSGKSRLRVGATLEIVTNVSRNSSRARSVRIQLSAFLGNRSYCRWTALPLSDIVLVPKLDVPTRSEFNEETQTGTRPELAVRDRGAELLRALRRARVLRFNGL